MILLTLPVCVIVGLIFALLLASMSLLESNDLGNSEGELSDFADGPLEIREFRKRIPRSELREAEKKYKKSQDKAS